MARPVATALIDGTHQKEYAFSALGGGLPITLIGSATNTPILEWEWSIISSDPDNEGGVPESSGLLSGSHGDFTDGKSSVQNPTITLDVAGGYCFSLRARNADGWSLPTLDKEGVHQAIVYIRTQHADVKQPPANQKRYHDDLNDALQALEDGLGTLLKETGGPDILSLGAIADGEILKRSGTAIVGGSETVDTLDESHAAGNEIEVSGSQSGVIIKDALGWDGDELLRIDLSHGGAQYDDQAGIYAYVLPNNPSLLEGYNRVASIMAEASGAQLGPNRQVFAFRASVGSSGATDATSEQIAFVAFHRKYIPASPGTRIAFDAADDPFGSDGVWDAALRAATGAIWLEDGQVRMKEISSDPVAIAEYGFLYTKDVAGTTELFYRDSAGNVRQLTPLPGSSPLTTKGDIHTYDTVDTRLAIGADGQILVADSSEDTGMKWGNAPSASPLTDKGDIHTYDTDDARLAIGSDGQFIRADSGEDTGMKWETVPVSPMTTKGDLWSRDPLVEPEDVRLPVGTDGQVLTADSAEATGLKWDDAASGSSPLTTKGDIHTYDTDDARLAVGTDGQVLVADSSEATGVKWDDAASGSSPLTTKGDLHGYSTTDARIPAGANGQVLLANDTEALGVKWATPSDTQIYDTDSLVVEMFNRQPEGVGTLTTGTGFQPLPGTTTPPSSSGWVQQFEVVHAGQYDISALVAVLSPLASNTSSITEFQLLFDESDFNGHPEQVLGANASGPSYEWSLGAVTDGVGRTQHAVKTCRGVIELAVGTHKVEIEAHVVSSAPRIAAEDAMKVTGNYVGVRIAESGSKITVEDKTYYTHFYGSSTVQTDTNFATGIRLYFTQVGTMTGIRFYTAETGSVDFRGKLWNNTTEVASGTLSTSAAGVYDLTFTTPYQITESMLGDTFYISLLNTTNGDYSATISVSPPGSPSAQTIGQGWACYDGIPHNYSNSGDGSAPTATASSGRYPLDPIYEISVPIGLPVGNSYGDFIALSDGQPASDIVISSATPVQVIPESGAGLDFTAVNTGKYVVRMGFQCTATSATTAAFRIVIDEGESNVQTIIPGDTWRVRGAPSVYSNALFEWEIELTAGEHTVKVYGVAVVGTTFKVLGSATALNTAPFLTLTALTTDSSIPENIPWLEYDTTSTIDIVAAPGAAASLRVTLNDGIQYRADAPLSIDMAVSGLGGLDTGSTSGNTWYNIFAVPSTVAAVFDVTASIAVSSVGPTGFSAWKHLGWVRVDGFGDIEKFWQTGARFHRSHHTGPTTMGLLHDTVPQTANIDDFVPPSAVDADIVAEIRSSVTSTQATFEIWAYGNSGLSSVVYPKILSSDEAEYASESGLVPLVAGAKQFEYRKNITSGSISVASASIRSWLDGELVQSQSTAGVIAAATTEVYVDTFTAAGGDEDFEIAGVPAVSPNTPSGYNILSVTVNGVSLAYDATPADAFEFGYTVGTTEIVTKSLGAGDLVEVRYLV